jgi:SMODS-associating 2TM, beta-strand rich effector domain
MRRAFIVRVTAAAVIAVFVIGTWTKSRRLELGWLKYFSTAVLVATVALALWDTWLWRLAPIQKLPGVPRSVRGTWKGTLTSFWVDPNTGHSPAPKTVYLIVRQTATLLSVMLVTNESRSTSTLGTVSSVDGSSALTYLYLNRPDMRVEHRSRMHHGSTALDISGLPVTRLKGRYWTDRDSKGELDFQERVKALAEDFDTAARLF